MFYFLSQKTLFFFPFLNCHWMHLYQIFNFLGYLSKNFLEYWYQRFWNISGAIWQYLCVLHSKPTRIDCIHLNRTAYARIDLILIFFHLTHCFCIYLQSVIEPHLCVHNCKHLRNQPIHSLQYSVHCFALNLPTAIQRCLFFHTYKPM